MSPATLRRYRAERLLERDFRSLRGSVVATVGARLRCTGATLDPADLDACYASAWQGLYAAALAGEEIANPRAWLVLVTYRRAIEELRASRRREELLDTEASSERDLDGELDDRASVRALLQGMRARLGVREREAAALCYLHGYSRNEAARLMGLSSTRMRKLMEGNKGRAGVSAKVGELAETIRQGAFCEQQGSLMRALAFGVLDPAGERYALAVQHRRNCPACRRYVATLRGAASLLPPVLALPGADGASLLGLAGLAHRAAAAHASVPSLGASAAAGGGGAAGGGWAIGGAGLGAKLAAGCLLAVGIGAGCVAIERGGHAGRRPHDQQTHQTRAQGVAAAPQEAARTAPLKRLRTASATPRARAAATSAAARARGEAPLASREFSIEQTPSSPLRPSVARARASIAGSASGSGRSSSPAPGPEPPSAAAHEFSPG